MTRRPPRAAAIRVLTGAAALLAAAPAADASVLGITINNADTQDYTLTSLTVNRGSGGIRTYTPSQMTGVDLTDVAGFASVLAVPGGSSLPAAGTRAALLEDWRVDTGIVNPLSTGAAADRSFEVTFLAPIVNSDGADLVVFDLGAGDPTAFWVHDDRTNHRHDVVAGDFDTNLLTGMPFSFYRYNNDGDQNVEDLLTLEDPDGSHWSLDPNAGPTIAVAAVTLDLSDFGIAFGDSVSSLRWQSTSSANRIDTVFIAGLPAIPEPASFAGLAAGALALGLRPRRL